MDPATNHYYQPLWTLVGAGVSTLESTRKSMKQVLPKGVRWIKQAVQKFNPEENNLQLDNEEQVSYDYLVVCPGIQVNWSDIKGLKENIGKMAYALTMRPNMREKLGNNCLNLKVAMRYSQTQIQQ